MANVKISNLTAATTPLAGTEVLPVVQSGATVKASIANVQTATYSGGTANGVAYLNGSKVLTTGSALVFDGTNLGVGVTPSASTLPTIQSEHGVLSGNSGINIIQNSFYNTNFKYTGTGLATRYYQGAGKHEWYTAASGTAGNAITFTQAMTLDASGNLGIGTTSPSTRLHLKGASGTTTLRLEPSSSTSIYTQVRGANGDLYLEADPGNAEGSSSMLFTVDGTERARIDSSGNLLVGLTSTVLYLDGKTNSSSSSAPAFCGRTSGGSGTFTNIVWNDATSGDNGFVAFGTEGTFTTRGAITYNRGAGLVAYNVTSDYRAKDISGPVVNSGTLIDSVPVYMGTMKGATQERPMFIAHETPAYAHTGEKDAVDADGNPVYQQMDASALIPVMWAEIQSLRKRLAALESA